MSTVTLMFYKGRGTFWDTLIRWWTDSLYSRCEILFEDSRMFSADGWNSKEVRYTTKYELANWVAVTIQLSEHRVRYMRQWCDSKVGQKYDWTGVLRFVLPILPQIENRWFCSELCGSALKYVGVFDSGVDVHSLSPQGLYMLALRHRQR